LISCSIGVATVSATVCADAPGYCAVTTTVGGAICGYSEIGRVVYAITPTTSITMDSTIASTGWLIDRRPRFIALRPAWRLACRPGAPAAPPLARCAATPSGRHAPAAGRRRSPD